VERGTYSLTGREAGSKLRRRQRIIDAAAEVLVSKPRPLSVADVADRAGVSRRTVFNYFPSVDDLIIAVGADALDGLVQGLNIGAGSPATTDDATAVFEEVAAALRGIDLVDTVVRATRILGGTGFEDPRIANLVRDTFVAIADRMTSALTAKHPAANAFEIELLVSALIGGVVVVYKNWVERVGLTDSEQSRRVWSELFETHLHMVRDGYLAATAPTD